VGKKQKKVRDKVAYNQRRKAAKKIGPISWRKFEKFLLHIGCEFVSQDKTSHRKYRKPGLTRPVIVPVHTKELAPFYIQNNLKTLGIGRQEYLEIMSQL